MCWVSHKSCLGKIDDLYMGARFDWRVLAFLCGGLPGCGLFTHHGVPEDPLFVNRKPLEARAVTAPPIALAQADPIPPANPYHVAGRSVPALLTNRPTAPAREE
jgi:hypothetical protein